jgi:hypothetical protein
MRRPKEPRPDLSGRVLTGRQTVVFVGHPRQFSDRMLSVFAAEFGDIDFVRVPDLGEPCEATQLHGDPVLTVLDETEVDHLLEQTDLYCAAAASGTLVLAYRDPAPAARLLAARKEHPALLKSGSCRSMSRSTFGCR